MTMIKTITTNLLLSLFYDDEGFDAGMGSLKWINVVAWCYIEDVYEELQKQEI